LTRCCGFLRYRHAVVKLRDDEVTISAVTDALTQQRNPRYGRALSADGARCAASDNRHHACGSVVVTAVIHGLASRRQAAFTGTANSVEVAGWLRASGIGVIPRTEAWLRCGHAGKPRESTVAAVTYARCLRRHVLELATASGAESARGGQRTSRDVCRNVSRLSSDGTHRYRDEDQKDGGQKAHDDPTAFYNRRLNNTLKSIHGVDCKKTKHLVAVPSSLFFASFAGLPRVTLQCLVRLCLYGFI
jgi:hypothetical protein